jgi:hypothetical protein
MIAFADLTRLSCCGQEPDPPIAPEIQDKTVSRGGWRCIIRIVLDQLPEECFL